MTLLAAGLGPVVGDIRRSGWPVSVWVRHQIAGQRCALARAVGLAPARVGQPGYWPHLDADRDGIACEPFPWWRMP